nr:MAG TPA: hypothetical protein [Caudoviricetes sp.]
MNPRLFRPYRGDVKNWKRGRVWVVRTSYSISPARTKSPGFRTSPAPHSPPKRNNHPSAFATHSQSPAPKITY